MQCYQQYSRDAWRELWSTDTIQPIPLQTQAHVDAAEIKTIYLPLVKLLALQYAAYQHLQAELLQATRGQYPLRPFLLGIVGGTAVGKSALAQLLRDLLQLQFNQQKLQVDLALMDGFIAAEDDVNQQPQSHNHGVQRRGFAKSYDWPAILQFLTDLQLRRFPLRFPLYSHQAHRLSENNYQQIIAPDIVIIEGANLLCPVVYASGEQLAIADFLDFIIYLEADTATAREWYLQRQQSLVSAERHPELLSYWQEIWEQVHVLNLHESILPFQSRGDVILHKSPDHQIDTVCLRI